MYLSNGEKVLIGCSVGVALMLLLGIVIISCEISSFESKVFRFLTGEGDGVYYAGNIDERIRTIQGDIETMWQGPINQIRDAVVEKPEPEDDKDRELCDEVDFPAYIGNCYRERIRAIDLINYGEPGGEEIKCEGLYVYHQLDEKSTDGWHIGYTKLNGDEWTGWFDYEYLVDNCKVIKFD